MAFRCIHNLPLNRKSVFLTRHGAWVQPPYMAHSNMKILTNPNSWHRKACQFAPVKGVLQLHPKTPTLHHKALLLFFHALWNHKQVHHNTRASPAFSKSSGYILPDIHLWIINLTSRNQMEMPKATFGHKDLPVRTAASYTAMFVLMLATGFHNPFFGSKTSAELSLSCFLPQHMSFHRSPH